MSRYLPDYQPSSGSRPTASELNRLATVGEASIYAGYNEVLPFVYGRRIVGGPIIAFRARGATAGVGREAGVYYAVALTQVQNGQSIESVESVIYNGVAQSAPVPMGSNPTVVNLSEYLELRFYDGTQTEPDAVLSYNIDDFNNSFYGVAYVAIRVHYQQFESPSYNFNYSLRFDIKGRKCFDPRVNQWLWTENPSLHMRDFITDQRAGLAKQAVGVEECADYNDSIYSGLPMARTNLVINEAHSEKEMLDLLSVYAECFWSYEGDTIRMVPDKAVDQPDAIIYKNQIRDGSVVLSGAAQDDIPTSLSIIYSDSLIPATVYADDVDVALGSEGAQSDVYLPGVYRTVEAQRRAWSRFMRLQTPGRIAFQVFDDGVKYQLGDVLALPGYMGLDSVWIRVSSHVEPVEIGVYQISGEIYSPDFYPTDSGFTTVPEGGVLFGPNRQGFDALTAGLVRGVATKAQEGAKAGTGTSSNITIPLAPSGAHGSGDADVTTLKVKYVDIEAPMVPNPNYNPFIPTDLPWNPRYIKQSPWPPVTVPSDTRVGASEAPSHTHNIVINSGIVTQSLTIQGLGAQVRNAGVDYNATGLSFISVSEIPTTNVTTQFGSGQLISSSTKNQNGRAAVTVTSTQAGAHTHEPDPVPSDKLMSGFTSSGSTTYYVPPLSAATNHVHQTTVAISTDLKRVHVATHTFTSLSDGLIPVGGIIGFVGGAIPDNWSLCDGSNGTPNLVDRFLVRGRQQDLGKLEGNDTAKIGVSGTVTESGHNHTLPRSRSARLQTETTAAHTKIVSHTHAMNAEDIEFNYVPDHYGMRFIQYLGE